MSTTDRPSRRKPSSPRILTEAVLRTDATAELVEMKPEPTRAERITSELRRGTEVLEKPRVEWLVPGFLPARSVGVLYGPPGSGKSFVALSLALAMAAGHRWNGTPLSPSEVLYVIAERADVVTEREEAWTLHHRHTIPARFSDWKWAPQIATDEDMGILLNKIHELRPRLVVLDTLARCILGKDENSAQDMGPVAENLSRLAEATDRGSVLVVHHSGKDAGRGMRGSTALLGAVDYTLEVAGDASAIRVANPKMNAGPEVPSSWWKLERVLMPALPGEDEMRSGAVLVPTSSRDAGGSRVAELVKLMHESYLDTGITRAEVDELLQVKRTTSSAVLAAAVADAYLYISGRGRAARYFLTEKALEEMADS